MGSSLAGLTLAAAGSTQPGCCPSAPPLSQRLAPRLLTATLRALCCLVTPPALTARLAADLHRAGCGGARGARGQRLVRGSRHLGGRPGGLPSW
jgi:hypothetical protein